MDLAFLHPLYEQSGPWASVYVDTSRHTENTPHERHLAAAALARELDRQGADESTCRAVQRAVEELGHSSEPHGRALFARAGEVVLDPPLAARPPQGDRIDELLIRPDGPDTHREVWIGEDADQVAVRRTELKTLGEQRSWAARADDALIRSAVATDAGALVVPPEAAEEAPVRGLGALLRWK